MSDADVTDDASATTSTITPAGAGADANRPWEQPIDSGLAPADGSRFDLIVVGGGPAGSATASYAALAGHRVLLLERARFPRDKTCGDAVGGNALDHLDELGVRERLTTQPHLRVTGALFGGPDGTTLVVDSPRNAAGHRQAGFTLPRRQLDHLLFTRAVELVRGTGGAVVQGFAVTEPLYDDGAGGDDPGAGAGDARRMVGVHGRLGRRSDDDTRTYRAPLTVGAGGLHCPVAAALVEATYGGTLVDPGKAHYSAAYRQYWRGVAGLAPDKGPIELHFLDEVRPGYFWIFPEADGLANVGLGIALRDLARHPQKLKGLQAQVIREHPLIAPRFADAELVPGSSQGWQLPLGSPRRGARLPPRRGLGHGVGGGGGGARRVAPVPGAGVGNALVSAHFAAQGFDAQTHADGFPLKAGEAYQRAVWDKLGTELTNSYKLQKLLRHRWLLNRFLRKANRKPVLQAALTEALASREAQDKVTSKWFLLRHLLF